MAAEPFIAIPLTKPDCMRSFMMGPSPTLMTCPPNPHRIGFPEDRAYRMARISLRRLSPARMWGSFDMKPSTFSDPSNVFPNIDVLTLLLRDSNEYVEIPVKSRGWMRYSLSTMINLGGKFLGTVRGQPIRK